MRGSTQLLRSGSNLLIRIVQLLGTKRHFRFLFFHKLARRTGHNQVEKTPNFFFGVIPQGGKLSLRSKIPNTRQNDFPDTRQFPQHFVQSITLLPAGLAVLVRDLLALGVEKRHRLSQTRQ